jgi:hypothetical protein
MTTPCDNCPFLKKFKRGYTLARLNSFARGEFHCHQTGDIDDEGTGDFIANKNSVHCAGALIFLEKRNRPHQIMRIAERIGMYDRFKLNMKAAVR